MNTKQKARSDKSFDSLNEIVDSLKKVDVFPNLTWLYVWDIVRDIFEHPSLIENDGWDEYNAVEGVTLKQVWDKLYSTANETQFSLEEGPEAMYEDIHEWMIQNDFIVMTSREELYVGN